MSKSIFRKASLDSISSPEQLNDYIKVSSPSIWMVLAALFILLAAVFVWGFTGSLPTTVHAEGAVFEGSVLCYINMEDADKIGVGQQVVAAGNDGAAFKGSVSGVGPIPLSAEEIASELNSDYLAEALFDGEYAVKVTVALENSELTEGMLLNLSIVTDSIRPIDFLLK